MVSDIKKGTIDLTVGSPTKNLIKFSLPLLLGNVFQLFYSWTDAIIIGQKAPLQFGALSACMPVINLLLTILMGFMAGAVVIVGQYFGKKDFASLKRCYSTIVIVLLGISIILTVAGSIFSRPLLKLLQVDESQLGYATTYLTYYFLGIFFTVYYNCFAQVLRAIGNSKFPLYALIVCVLLNVLLDWLFVSVYKMDIEGVAIGTMISQALSSLILFVYIQLKVPALKITRKDFSFDKKILKQILNVALPSTIQQACACVGFMYINALINSKGDIFTTAFGLGNRIDELMNMQFNSFGIALTNFAAQNKGKGEIERIKKGFKSTLIITAVCLFVSGAFILIFKDFIIRLFIGTSPDTQLDIEKVIEVTHGFLWIVVPSYILMSYMVITSGCLRGAGDAKAAMTVNLFSLLLRVTAATILTSALITNPYFMSYGIFYASPIGWLAGTIWAIVRYKQGRWQKIEVI
ncbi:MAG: MATE family efflux transporter [Clostridia bacterium]